MLKKIVMWASIGTGCAAVIIGIMLMPLGNLMGWNQSSGPAEEPAVRTGADGNWGLSFPEEGETPVGNADAQYLAKYNAWYTGPADKENKTVYLTFDAGYENGYTEKILDVLKEKEVPAAFFLVGNYIEEHPEIVKRMAAEGHIVGNHTMHHPDMSAIADEAAFREEISGLEEIYQIGLYSPCIPRIARTLQKLFKFVNRRCHRPVRKFAVQQLPDHHLKNRTTSLIGIQHLRHALGWSVFASSPHKIVYRCERQ